MKVIPTEVTTTMNKILLNPFSEGEVTRAIKDMFPTKAPGYDGFPDLFYQKYQKLVGPKTIESCLVILNRRESIKELNKTNTALIPNTADSRLVYDYRPISLCNMSYKVVPKCIATRLKRILDDIIFETQSTFISGRAITDNIIISHECIHATKNIRSCQYGVIALKLDMSKA